MYSVPSASPAEGATGEADPSSEAPVTVEPASEAVTVEPAAPEPDAAEEVPVVAPAEETAEA